MSRRMPAPIASKVSSQVAGGSAPTRLASSNGGIGSGEVTLGGGVATADAGGHEGFLQVS